MTTRDINDGNGNFQNAGELIKETDSIMLHPYHFFTFAVKKKFTKTQIRYLRQELQYYADPELLLKNEEIAEIQKLNPAWWQEWYAELQTITVMYYVIEVLRWTAPQFFPELLKTLPEKEKRLQERLQGFLEKLHNSLGQTEDTKMRYLIYRLGRRLLAPWASDDKACHNMPR